LVSEKRAPCSHPRQSRQACSTIQIDQYGLKLIVSVVRHGHIVGVDFLGCLQEKGVSHVPRPSLNAGRGRVFVRPKRLEVHIPTCTPILYEDLVSSSTWPDTMVDVNNDKVESRLMQQMRKDHGIAPSADAYHNRAIVWIQSTLTTAFAEHISQDPPIGTGTHFGSNRSRNSLPDILIMVGRPSGLT
jgi:hypothetical protein